MSHEDTPKDESLTPDEIDDGLAFAYGEESQQDPSPSVLERIGKVAGRTPKVSLRDGGDSDHTPLLKPLGPDDDSEAGKYTVQGELGRGGVGAVHKGYDKDLGRDVAMKFLHERYKDDPTIIHRFVEEAQIGGQLQHPGIVPVYELGMAGGRPFFTMKMIKGQTLARKLAERTSPADDRRLFLSIFEGVCQTMAYAHVRGVVHRDLKPANIMIGSFGEVQVVDWGMGKVLSSGGVDDEKLAAERQSHVSVIETVRSDGHGTHSVVGSVMGTPAYMPPEQARGEVDAMDTRSDVFALGAILCEILTGQPPYVGPKQDLVRMAAMAELDGARARLASCNAEADLVAIATNCLMPSRAARPQSAEAVASAVQAHLAAAEQRVHDATVRTLTMKRTQKLGAVLIAAIAIGCAVSLWFWQDADAQRRIAETAVEKESHARQLADQRAEEASLAREASRQSLSRFNLLAHAVRFETAKATEASLNAAWPQQPAALRTWLDDARNLTEEMPKVRSTIVELEVRALPQSEEAAVEARQNHPRAEELAALEQKLAVLRRADAVRNGAPPPEPFELDDDRLPTAYLDLNGLAWPLVAPNRQRYGRETEGLALARRALAGSPPSGIERATVGDTLAWALSTVGLDAEALAVSQAAWATAPESERPRFAQYRKKLEAAIQASSGIEGRRAIETLAGQVATIAAEVSARSDWQFADAADGYLHKALRALAGDVAEFEKTDVPAMRQRLAWSERVESLTVQRHRERWREARNAILAADGKTASARYGEVPIELEPQLGLIPIGMNPVTQLWEFYHLRSAWDGVSEPGDLELPIHREDGSIEVTEATGIVFVLLPGTTYWMGAQKTDPNGPNYDPLARSDESPRRVEVAPFFLARHELSQAQWARLWIGAEELRHPSHYGPGYMSSGMASPIDATHPVEMVDWAMSHETMLQHGLMLPTETQWEYGCRGATSTPYWFDFAEFKNYANVADATAQRLNVPWECEPWADGHVVHAAAGAFPANPFGLHEVHGGVWEWCDNSYERGTLHVSRGGSFAYLAIYARSAYRSDHVPTIRSDVLGLRAARALRTAD